MTAPDPKCKWCGGRQWIVMGDEPQPCWCVKAAPCIFPDCALHPTDLTTDNSAQRGRRDALRHEAGE